MKTRPILLLAALAPLVALAFAPARAPRWWKGNLHTHTLWSDGNDFPEMVVDWYREQGYQFLALSDHNVIADHERWIENDIVVRRGGRSALKEYRERFGREQVDTREGENGKLEVRLKTLDEFRGAFDAPGEFLLLTAEEITDRADGRPIHMNATNVAEVIAPQGGRDVRDVISRNLRAVREQAERLDRPILAHVNHPNFGWAITAEDLAYVPEEKYFEVFNGHPSVHQLGDETRVGIDRMWDIANAIRIAELGLPPLFGLATDDSHQYHNERGSISGRGWIQVRATELSAEALIAAIEAGDFYASSGVELSRVEFADGALTIEVDAQRGVGYRIDFVGTREGATLESTPVVDAEGKELPVTRRYTEAIGERLATVHGPQGRYELHGDELYVRAVVSSDRAPPRPVWDGQCEQAWTQPVGWRAGLERR